MFDDYLDRWNLTPDGAPILTHCSRLLPVRRGGEPAMLKIAMEAEEKLGFILMRRWDGDGAARVLAREGDALLLERAQGNRSLAEMARTGQDEEATRILCRATAKLHTPRAVPPPPSLLPLSEWFAALEPAAKAHGGILLHSEQTARDLLADQRDITPLHGDIHHDNILDFGERGWLAIDPKRLIGERGFDYANIFRDPDYAVATAPGYFERRLEIVAEEAGLPRQRLLRWILAWAGLSAAWFIGDGMWEEAKTDFFVAEKAAAMLEA